jgi:hypothetical protein
VKRGHSRSILVLGVLWLLIADVATAGEYVLMLGKGIEVCEAFLKNLNSFPDDPPMVCDRKVNPKFPEFSKPAWQPLDALKNLDLIEQIERWKPYETEFKDPKRREEILASIKARIENGEVQLAVTKLDIEQNGTTTKETVLRYEYADCNPANESHFTHSAGRRLYALNAERTQIDIEKSENIRYLGRADVFLFKDHVYLTQWGGHPGFRDGTLSISPPCT